MRTPKPNRKPNLQGAPGAATPPVDMRDQTKGLRDLGVELEAVARRHRCYSQASPYIVVLRDFLAAVGAVDELNHEVAKQAAEIARLRAALKPFAEAAGALNEDHADNGHLWESPSAMTITAGDLRRARAVQEGVT